MTTQPKQQHKPQKRRNVSLDDDRAAKASRISRTGNVSDGIRIALDAYEEGKVDD